MRFNREEMLREWKQMYESSNALRTLTLDKQEENPEEEENDPAKVYQCRAMFRPAMYMHVPGEARATMRDIDMILEEWYRAGV